MSDLPTLFGMMIGVIGIMRILSHLFIGSAWIAYLFGWHLRKSNYQNHKNVCPRKLWLDWPKCPLLNKGSNICNC